MEHDLLQELFQTHSIKIDDTSTDILAHYAEMVHEANRRFNLTGYDTISEIMLNLIIKSIEPVAPIIVPRGTRFADIGTGAGVPGVPLAVYRRDWTGVLIDSNQKKISFLQGVIRECALNNLQTVSGRLEELAHESLRGSFDYVFSRALGDLYFVIEIGGPLLKQNGLLYIYSNERPEGISRVQIDHAEKLGLTLVQREYYNEFGIRDMGLLFRKTGETDGGYPRRMAVIKREIRRIQ